MAIWIARNSDNAWMVRGFGDPALIHTQPSAYTEVEVPGDVVPDPRTTRHDPAAVSKIRAATVAEVGESDQARADQATAAAAAAFSPELQAVIAWVASALNISPTVAKYEVSSHLRRINRKRAQGS